MMLVLCVVVLSDPRKVLSFRLTRDQNSDAIHAFAVMGEAQYLAEVSAFVCRGSGRG